jgi:poly(ADP-ribose) glycohydrolase ARH3
MLFGGRGSFGNGAAMRVMPVGLLFFDSPRLYEEAVKSAEPTHTHPLAKDGAALLAKAIAEVITLHLPQDICVKKFCRKLKDFSKTKELKRKLSLIPQLILKNASNQEAKDTLGTAVTAQDSVPFAIYVFLKNKCIFKDCLFEAVLSGGDRDTIGAMGCALSGAYLGMEALPKEWIEKLENNLYIKDLALRLWRLKNI